MAELAEFRTAAGSPQESSRKSREASCRSDIRLTRAARHLFIEVSASDQRGVIDFVLGRDMGNNKLSSTSWRATRGSRSERFGDLGSSEKTDQRQP